MYNEIRKLLLPDAFVLKETDDNLIISFPLQNGRSISHVIKKRRSKACCDRTHGTREIDECHYPCNGKCRIRYDSSKMDYHLPIPSDIKLNQGGFMKQFFGIEGGVTIGFNQNESWDLQVLSFPLPFDCPNGDRECRDWILGKGIVENYHKKAKISKMT